MLYIHERRGGVYRYLGMGRHKAKRAGEWEAAVFYQNVATDELYSTVPERWNENFSVVNSSHDR